MFYACSVGLDTVIQSMVPHGLRKGREGEVRVLENEEGFPLFSFNTKKKKKSFHQARVTHV